MARPSLQDLVRTVIEWLTRVLTQPRSELTKWQGAVRYAYDLGRYGALQLRRDQAPQMAAALSFRALFSVLPVFVVATLLVRAMGGGGQFEELLRELFTALGLDDLEVTTTVTGGAPSTGEAAATGAASLSDWMLQLVAQAQKINVAAVTWVGIAVLIYSALSLMVTIEGCFNGICRAPEGRSWMRRVPIYWTTLTLAPAVVGLAAYGDARFDAWVSTSLGWEWLLRIMPLLSSFLATAFVLFIAYKLVPATTVATRPAIIGAIVAAILIEIGKRTMGAYLSNAVSISQLYGSLGLVPLFMFWIYIMWLVVLFGLEVAAALQMLAGRRLEEMEMKEERTGLVDPASIILVMEAVAERFRASRPAPPREIADEAGLPEHTVRLMLERLVAAGYLHRLDRDDAAVALARPLDDILAGDLIDIGYAMVDVRARGQLAGVLDRLREAQRSLAARSTLVDLLAAKPAPAAGDQANPA